MNKWWVGLVLEGDMSREVQKELFRKAPYLL